MSNVGYAFVNFVNTDWANRCILTFQGYRFKRHRKSSGKIAAISTAHLQGLEAQDHGTMGQGIPRLIVMASNLLAMASNLRAMASSLPVEAGQQHLGRLHPCASLLAYVCYWLAAPFYLFTAYLAKEEHIRV